MTPEDYTKDSVCHELGEWLDALEYLYKDLVQARHASVALNPPEGPLSFDAEAEIRRAAEKLEEAVKNALKNGGCPAYKEAY